MSSAVAGAVLAQMTVTFGSAIVPSQNGFRVIMAIGACAALIALGVAAFIPRSRPRASYEAATPPVATATAR